MPGYLLQKGDGKMATYLQYGDEVVLTVPASAYKDKQIHVLTLSFDKKIEPFPGKPSEMPYLLLATLRRNTATPALITIRTTAALRATAGISNNFC